jgi:hypothetical protein
MVLVNSTKPTQRTLRLQSLFWHLGIAVLLAFATCQPILAQSPEALEREPVEDRLSSAEEELAYAAKTPSERVAAFLKIANQKMEAARKLHKAGSIEDLALCLRGYSSALQGAITAVAWGEDTGTSMQRQTAAIRKAMRRHAEILNKLEGASSSASKPSILQVRAALATAEIAPTLR